MKKRVAAVPYAATWERAPSRRASDVTTVRTRSAYLRSGLAATTATAAVVVGLLGSGGASGQGPTATPAVDRCAQPGPYALPRGSEPVVLDPEDFTTRIDHPYWPMRPGTVWHLVETADGETQRVTVTVTHRTRMIAGIEARVVHDIVRSHGEIVEDTLDWYAQDSGGNLWYLGEATEEYENGEVVSTEGSWEHGRDGAYAGVLLPARPRVGCAYREEFRPGEAEDRALVLARREAAEVPAGYYRRLLQTSNTTPLEPRLLENKFYARGVGPVLEVDLSPSFSRGVLVRVEHR